MEARTTTTTMTAKLPILNPTEYHLWLMRIEQYFLMTDYSLWEVIKNGNKLLKRTVRTVKQEYEPTIAEEKLDRKNEMKAIGTLLMAFLNKDQLNITIMVIRNHPSALEIYKKKLLETGQATKEDIDRIQNKVTLILNDEFLAARITSLIGLDMYTLFMLSKLPNQLPLLLKVKYLL
ncbi:hypothetical protein Tco_0010727 [Tanacetum coccineum]